MKSLLIIFTILFQIFCIPLSVNEKRELENEKSNDIIILHTNDVHCGVQDTIGYDGLMLYKKQLLKKYNNVILVDAGDHVQGGIMGLVTNGESIIEIMNKLEYDAVTLGNHEFDYGITQLETLEKLLNCSYISANYCYRKNKTSIYPPYKIIEKGNKKIGFIGIATPDTLIRTYLITLVDDSGETIYDFLHQNNNKELYERIQKLVEELKKENVDYIIIIGHFGKDGISSIENTSVNLLKNIKNVDAFIDGHTHQLYSYASLDKDGKNITLVQTGTKLANIGILTIHENGAISHKNINEVPYEPHLENETLNITRNNKVRYVDKEMNEFINNLFDSFSDKLNIKIGEIDFNLRVESTSKIEENAFCNFLSDSFREFGEADISIVNLGEIRSDIKKGNITYKDVLNSIPFSNDIFVKEIPGKNILEALEYGVRAIPLTTIRVPQVSGITYKVDTSINSSVIMDENGSFERIEGENRVYDVKINGEKLLINKNYTISTINYLLEGGSGFSMLKNLETTKISIGVDNEIFLKYLRDNLGGIVPLRYKESEGRMIKTKGKIYDDINISLLGFNNLIIEPQIIEFNVYFASLEKLQFEFPKQLIFETSLYNKSNLRSLEENILNISCFIQNEVNETKVNYLCEIPGITSEIQTIQIKKPEFVNFGVKISPLASNYMNNLENIKSDKDLENLNKELCILQDSIYFLNESSLFISGIINSTDILPSFSNKQLILMVTQLPSKNETELNCTIDNKIESNYTLKCKLVSNINYDLDNSILIDDDKLLLINFEKGAEAQILNNEPISSTEINNKTTRRYFHNSNKKLTSGIIALIVIIPIISIAIIISIALFLRKSNKAIKISNENSREKFRVSS